ncbi:MAG: hypothetical protein IPJ97_03260 [Proteobacteria bacterium]|nr:hypothetical protein [Pseudomonadota bacterium]
MNPHDDETVLAYVDGELDAAAHAQFEAVMAADATLARRVDAQQQLRRRLGDAFNPTLLERVPERLLAAARGASPAESAVVPLSAATRRNRDLRPAKTAWFAMAASLVLGILIGQRWSSTSNALVVADENGTVARAALAEALETRLTSSPWDGNDPVRIGISYRVRSGEYCRTFAITGARASGAGIACRTPENEWRIELLERGAGAAGLAGAVRQASSAELPESVRRAVEATIAGDALDSAAEAAARDSGWQVLRAE